MGGWSQANYQRHIAKHHADFAQEAAAAIQRLIDRASGGSVRPGGAPGRADAALVALTDRTKKLIGDVLRVDIRAPRNEVAAEIAPVLRRMEADASTAIADQVVAAVRSDGLGVAGLEATRDALGNGRVDLLLLDASAELDDDHRNDLIRLAATTGADVEVVEAHPGLSRFGGVEGALLRYRPD